MRKTTALLLPFLLLTAPAALAAQAEPAAPAPATPPATPDATAPTAPTAKIDPKTDPNRRVCRREAVTGSMMAKTTCRTHAEWDAIALAARRALDSQRINGIGVPR